LYVDLSAFVAAPLPRARSDLVASFANSVVKDQAAVSAAITSPWSNGQTEGQITKLKLVKRRMYGRGKLDLLQARVIGAGYPESSITIKTASEPKLHAESHSGSSPLSILALVRMAGYATKARESCLCVSPFLSQPT